MIVTLTFLISGCSSKAEIEYISQTRLIEPPVDFLITCDVIHYDNFKVSSMSRMELTDYLSELYTLQVKETVKCNSRIDAIKAFIENNKQEGNKDVN